MNIKVVVIKDLSIWVTQCGHGREALKISRSASKITFPVLSILRLKTLTNSICPHFSTQRPKSRSVESWQLSPIRWFSAYFLFGNVCLVFELEDASGQDSSARRVWSDWRRVKRGSLVYLVFGRVCLVFKLEDGSAWRFSTD